MEANFEQKAGEKMAQLQDEEQAIIEKITSLQSTQQEGNRLLLNPEQQGEIANLRAQQVDFRRQLRDLQKDLQSEKDALSNKITLVNVAIMPLLVLIFGLVVYLRRQSLTRAK